MAAFADLDRREAKHITAHVAVPQDEEEPRRSSKQRSGGGQFNGSEYRNVASPPIMSFTTHED